MAAIPNAKYAYGQELPAIFAYDTVPNATAPSTAAPFSTNRPFLFLNTIGTWNALPILIQHVITPTLV
jgi:hypothetical protein